MRDKSLMVSIIFLVGLSILTLLGPFFSPYTYDQQDSRAILQSPSRNHWMGTDRLGRDLFTRLSAGGRISLSIGVTSALAALLIGTVYGGISGYKGGNLDHFLMRIVDVVYALPDLLLIILMMVILGRGFLGIFLALTFASWVTVARLIRGEVLRLKEQPFVESAIATGAKSGRILFFHIFPNTIGPLIVTLSYRIPAAILAESTLSFIGIGLAPPSASWGILANDGWAGMKFYPYLIFFPSLAIFLTILSLNTVGDRLRDYLDPTLGN